MTTDLDIITRERAQDIANGFAGTRDAANRQIAGAAQAGNVTGLDDLIRRSRRYDALVELWNDYADHGADEAARRAGAMIYRAVERSEIDAARLDAARSFLGDVHEQHTAHAHVTRYITHGIV